MSKNVIFLALTVIVSFALLSCSQEDLPENMTTMASKQEVNPNVLGISDALQIADDLYSEIYGNYTRAKGERKLTGYEILIKNFTRGEEKEDNGVYIFNYGDDEGFALVSRDRRNPFAYGVSDEGSLHLSDTLENQALGFYLNNLLPTGGIYFPNPNDSVEIMFPTLPTDRKVYSEPLIKGFMREFHQNYPYNKFCPVVDGKNCVVGCVPLAAGTVMGYFEWPNSSNGYSFDWSSMKSQQYHDSWARLFEICGRKNNLDTQYGLTGSGSSPLYLPRTFTNMGYSGTQYSSFDFNVVNSSLSSKKPVIVSGWRYNPDGTMGSNVGHTWVIDGGYLFIYKSVRPDFPDSYNYYYHNIWGYGGKSNGYFMYQQNNLNMNPSEYDNDKRFNFEFAYKYMTIAYGFTPKK